MNGAREIVAKTDRYTLTRIGGRMFLAAVCEAAGQDEVRIELNSEELRNYSRWGEYYVDGLAHKIARAPEAYSKRHAQAQAPSIF